MKMVTWLPQTPNVTAKPIALKSRRGTSERVFFTSSPARTGSQGRWWQWQEGLWLGQPPGSGGEGKMEESITAGKGPGRNGVTQTRSAIRRHGDFLWDAEWPEAQDPVSSTMAHLSVTVDSAQVL